MALPVTAALNCCVALPPSVTEPGVIVTETVGVSVTITVANFVLSAAEVAVIWMVRCTVTDVGAV